MANAHTYPDNFERKIGFDEVRTLLKGRCISSLGTEWVDNRVQFLTAYADVRQALDEVSEMRQFLEADADDVELNFFDVREALLRIRPERTHMEELEFFDLKRSLQTVIDFLQAIHYESQDEATDDEDDEEKEPSPYPALCRMADGVQSFPQIVRRIDDVLNKYGKVKDTASPELLTIRHTLEQTSRSISHSLRSLIIEAQNDGLIDRDVTPTLRDGRLVIPVAPSLKRKIKGIVHDESASGKTVFIEPTAVVEANNRIRELRAAEQREVIRILQELTLTVRPHIKEILASQQLLGHVDYLRALCAFSDAFEAIVPRLVKQPTVNWLEAVHPLLQQSLKRHGRTMNPLNITLPRGKNILLISGPNAGGKSVCLKTAGLLQYMLQCGMPVPVSEDSTAGLFSSIFIDIGDDQSLSDDLSTYSSHLLNMKEMMRRADSHSLLLIDEFGGGTEPQIGGALAEAILGRFVESGTMGIITTHYQNLKHFAQDAPTVVNGAMLYDRQQMQPLFVLQVGNPGSSFAIEIARKIGLPEDVIDRAREIVGQDYVLSDKYLLDIVRDKTYWENKRKNIHQREKHLEETIARYEHDVETLHEERKSVIRQAKNEAENLLQTANAKIENTIRSIREAQAEKERTQEVRREFEDFKAEVKADPKEEERIARKMESIRRRQERKRNGEGKKKTAPSPTLPQTGAGAVANVASPDGGRMEGAITFHTGDYVRMKGQQTVGRIESISGKQAKVVFGMIHTVLPFSRLEPATKPKADTVSKVSTFVSRETRDAVYEKKLHFKPEIDLRGMRADEALPATAYFIDDAILLEQSRVRILHGTGTGALRELVRNYLATVTGVRRYHDEDVRFGGAGITVVELE